MELSRGEHETDKDKTKWQETQEQTIGAFVGIY